MQTYYPVSLYEFAPPEQFPSIEKPARVINPAAIAISGTAVGAIAGAAGTIAYTSLTKRSSHQEPEVEVEESTEIHDAHTD
jgi:hypothetical protein